MKKSLYFLLLGFVMACSDIPTTFQTPKWDVDLNIPIADRRYQLEEIVKLSREVGIDSTDGLYTYKVNSQTYQRTLPLSDMLNNQIFGGDKNLSFPIATYDTTILIPMETGVKVDTANIKFMTIEFSLNNPTSSPLPFVLELPDLYSQADRSIYSHTGQVPANSNYVRQLVIENYDFNNSADDKGNVKINLTFTASTSSQFAKTSILISESILTYIVGILPPTDVSPDAPFFTLDVSEDMRLMRDKLFLQDTELILEASYLSKHNNPFEGELKNLRIVGKRSDGVEINLTDKSGNPNFNNIKIETTEYVQKFNNKNSNISEFLSFMPDDVIIYSDVLINPDGDYGTASDDDNVNLLINFNATGKLRIETVNSFDTLDLSIDSDMREEIRNGKFAKIYYDIESTLPIANDFNIIFANENYDSLFSKQFTLKGAPMINNNSTQMIVQNDNTELDSIQIVHLSNCRYVILDWKLATTENEEFVVFSPSQYIRFKVYAEVKYLVNLDK